MLAGWFVVIVVVFSLVFGKIGDPNVLNGMSKNSKKPKQRITFVEINAHVETALLLEWDKYVVLACTSWSHRCYWKGFELEE